MVTIYRTSADELNETFLESVRAAFKGKEIEIVVTESDETEYLLGSAKNREHLLQAVADINDRKNLVVPDQVQFG